MPYSLPSNIDRREVLVIGAGTLGARIALMFAAGGSPVRIYNRTPQRAMAAKEFVEQQVSDVRQRLGLSAPRAGEVDLVTELDRAVAGAWLIIESIAEDLAVKRPLLGEVDRLADPAAVPATHSCSYPTSQMTDQGEHPEAVPNLQFLMAPKA